MTIDKFMYVTTELHWRSVLQAVDKDKDTRGIISKRNKLDDIYLK